MNKMLKQIYLYTVLIHDMSTTITDQMPTFHIFGKGHNVLASAFFLAVYHRVSQTLEYKDTSVLSKEEQYDYHWFLPSFAVHLLILSSYSTIATQERSLTGPNTVGKPRLKTAAIGDCKFGQRKLHTGRAVKDQQVAVSSIEGVCGKSFLVPDKTADTLMAVISTWIEPSTIVNV